MNSGANKHDDKALRAARQAIGQVREALDAHFSVRLWDGSLEPLGANVQPGLVLALSSPGVLPSLLRWPSLDRIIRHYAHGRIDVEGGTILDLAGPFVLDKAPRTERAERPATTGGSSTFTTTSATIFISSSSTLRCSIPAPTTRPGSRRSRKPRSQK